MVLHCNMVLYTFNLTIELTLRSHRTPDIFIPFSNPNRRLRCKELLRRRYTIRFARTEPVDCPVHGSIVTCDMSLECPGHLKIGWKGFTARSIFEPILPPELCDYPIRAQQTPKTTFTLYDCERETGGVSQCTHPASKYFRICQHGILLYNQ